MHLRRRRAIALTLAMVAASISMAAIPVDDAHPPLPPAAQRAFDERVRPVFEKNCTQCHNPEKNKGGLDLTKLETLIKGAASGPVFSAGNAKESLLFQLVQTDSEPHMPPKKQIAAEEIAALRDWIDSLPKSTTVERIITDQDRSHWAFRPRNDPTLPTAADPDKWCRTPIDHFILAKLKEKGLTPRGPAAKIDLIRRATFDLIGLPPTPEEVQAFLADTAPDAYAKIIDRLLASPRYGERWGRHWLDLARYADSDGFEFDVDRPYAFRYRDYVVKSFNEDKPYHRFLVEQLAGDEIAPLNPDALTATGFCRCGPTIDNQENEKNRLDELDDVLGTASAVFMGLTVACARCHDHKYDPISQKDYYQLLAVFNNRDKTEYYIGTPDEKRLSAERRQHIDKRLKAVKQQLEDLAPTTADAAEPDAGEAKAREVKRQELRRQINDLEVQKRRQPLALGIKDAAGKARPTRLLLRGDHRTPGAEVGPGVPAVLAREPLSFPDPLDGARTSGRRTILAKWLAHPDHPLTARVMVNRIWQYHFHRGIVETSSNFGRNGSQPSHPELLDWLAGEFVKGGWRVKPLHKLIMTSAVYVQATTMDPEAVKRDPDNVWLWRYPRKRLEAEALRDSILAAAGTLNLEMYGPGVKPRIHPGLIATGSTPKWPNVEREGPEQWRRSVYVFVKRSVMLPLFEGFDAPTATQSCERRQCTTVPTQALQLLNGDFCNEQAGHLAERVRREVGDDPAKQVDRAFWLTLSRPPTEREREMAMRFLEDQGRHPPADAATRQGALAGLCHVLFNLNAFVYLN